MDLASPEHERKLLLLRTQQGDPSALTRLLDLETSFLNTQIQMHLGDRLREVVEPDDVLQEVRIKILRTTQAVQFPNIAAFRGWLKLILLNCLRDLFRRHFRTKRRTHAPKPVDDEVHGSPQDGAELPAEQRGPSSIARLGEHVGFLRQVLSGLRPDQRRLLERVHFEHERLQDIAAQDGTSAGAVRMRYHRALRACRRCMERRLGGGQL